MAISLRSEFTLQALLDYQNSLDAGSAVRYPLNWPQLPKLTWLSGAGASQADRVWLDERTLGASANEDLDLNGTALQDAFGQNLALLRVKALFVFALPGNTNNVVVGGAAANTWVGPFGAATHTVALSPGGLLAMINPTATGWPVTAGTGDLLRFTNSAGGTSVNYQALIVGASS